MSCSFFFGAASPIQKLTWVFLRHRRLLLLREARTAKSVICGTSHLVTTCARRWSDGGGLRVLLRARHTQEDRGRVRCCAWTRQATAQGDPHVQHHDRGSPRTRRLADGTAGDTRCARKHGRVLETSMWNVLESSFTMLLVNARHIKQVPGRKTDEWIADLLRHGLLRASFVPDRPQRELRELTRYRTTLIRERAAERSRIQKTLEGAGIKLGDVASDVFGASGRQMLEALVRGVTDASLV